MPDLGPRAAPLPTDFRPPEGWTFLARTLEEVIVGGEVPMDDAALPYLQLIFQGLSPRAVVRCYVYPSMFLTMVWSPEGAMWIGNAVGR